MRTGAEPIAGGIAWTAFPANPRVPPIFPLRTGKHHAGVAELVDALVLGSGQSTLTNQSLRLRFALDCGGLCANRLKSALSPTSTARPANARP